RGVALAGRAREEIGRARRAFDAVRGTDGGVLHADAGQDHESAEGPRGLLMAKTTRVVMPQLGESVHEGTISRWLGKPGDKVAEFEPMLEVDTDKVNAEVPAQVAPGVGDQVVQLTRVRRLIAENMARAKATIPHAWQTQEVDMSGVVANRNANKAAFQKQEGFSLTYLPYVMTAAISALREHPEVNSTFNETELILHRDLNLGISVGMEDTLLVPVVRKADGLSIAG